MTQDSRNPPEGWTEIDAGMSNCEGGVEPETDKRLREGDVYGRHAGWNFNGLVWFDRERKVFCEAVYCYGSHRRTMTAETLEELKREVNDEYGWD